MHQRIAKRFKTDPPFYATIGWQNVRLDVNNPKISAKLVSEVGA